MKTNFSLLKRFISFENGMGNTQDGYQAMIRQYCETNGYSNYILSKIISFKYRRTTKFVLSALKAQRSTVLNWEDNIQTLIKTLKKDGYVVLKTKVPTKICDDLKKFAEDVKCLPSGMDDSEQNYIQYKKNEPKATTYNFRESELINNPIIQSLACDPKILETVTKYLKAPPILDLVAMWWSTCFKKEADARSAQLYHFDMDRLHWLKVFFYLTDVDKDTGAHCYISKSHRPGQKPKEIRKRGYARILDSDLKAYFPQENFKEIEGKTGTIIIGDTAAYHKGKPLVRDHRLVLEFEYTNSMFGAPTTQLAVDKPIPTLIDRKSLHPKMFEKYKIV